MTHNPTKTTSPCGEKSVTVSQHKHVQQRPLHFVCGYPGVCRVPSCVLSGCDDPIVWMEMPLQIGDRLVRVTGNEYHNVLGLVCESSAKSIDSMGNGFKCPVIDHGHAFTVICQQSSRPNVNADGEATLVDDAIHLPNGVSHLLVGSEKSSEDHASILLPCFVGSHDSALDEESAIVLVVHETWIQSSIPQH